MSATAESEVPRLFDPEPLVHRATGLLRRLGLEEGERLVTLLRNSPEALALGMACQLTGVVQVPLQVDVPRRELEEIVGDAEASALLVSPQAERADAAEEVADVAVHRLAPGGLDDERAVEPNASWPLTRPMSYTSGTTGKRKGVYVGLHDEEWGRVIVHDEHQAFDGRHGERHLVVSSLHHSGPFRFAFVTALLGGQVAVLPGFDAELFREALRQVRPTSLFCVPTHLRRLFALPDLDADDLASLDLLAHAGAACPRPLKERVLETAAEGSVWEFYGSSEGQFTVCPPDVWREAPESVGHARPGRQLEVRGEEGETLPPGEVGRVWVHAPEHATWEYWRDPERTEEAWDGDAFTVDDLGRLDDQGRLWLEGRADNMVISGGVNVYPAEVERRLLEHEAVAEAVAFGIPDEEWGERLVAAVIPARDADPDPEELRDHVREGLQRAKVPKEILVVDELPRTSTGKIARKNLQEEFGFDP